MLKSSRSRSAKAEHAPSGISCHEIEHMLVGSNGCQEAGPDLSTIILCIASDGWTYCSLKGEVKGSKELQTLLYSSVVHTSSTAANRRSTAGIILTH